MEGEFTTASSLIEDELVRNLGVHKSECVSIGDKMTLGCYIKSYIKSKHQSLMSCLGCSGHIETS